MTDSPLTDTQLDLDAIQARAQAATPGPWGFYDGDNYADVAADLTMTGRASYSYRQKIAQLEDENYWDDPAHEDDDESRASEQMAANAEFIAHAREDVPALVAEVHRLRAQLEDQADADTVAARAAQAISAMGADLRAARAERDRYRSAWQSARSRAQAYGEGILRHVAARDFWKSQAKDAAARPAPTA